MKKTIFAILLLLCTGLIGYAKELVVKSVDELRHDISARTAPRFDSDSIYCALIRLNLPSLEEFDFGDMIVGDVKAFPGEYVLYVRPNAKNLTFICNGKETSINFSDYNISIEEKKCYRIILKEKEEKNYTSKTQVYITANYDNTIVLVDGVPMGSTPLLIESIEDGFHTVSIPNINGITMRDTVINVMHGTQNYIELNLQREYRKPVKLEYSAMGGDSYLWEPIIGINSVEENGKIGLINYVGEVLIPCEFDQIYMENLWNNYFVVANNNPLNPNHYLKGIYEPEKGLIVPCIYDVVYVYGFDEGIIMVSKEGKKGIVDSSGNIIIPVEYDKISASSETGDFSNCLFSARKQIGNQGYKSVIFNSKGTCLGEYNYDYLSEYSNGYYFFRKDWPNTRKGLLNINGEEIFLPNNYDLSEGFNCGLLRVYDKITKKYGYCDANFNLIIPAIYDEASKFNAGVAQVSIAGNNMIIDVEGHEILNYNAKGIKSLSFCSEEFNSESISSIDQGPIRYFEVIDFEDKIWIYDLAGKVMVSPGRFQEFSAINDKKTDKIYYIGTYDTGEIEFLDSELNILFKLPSTCSIENINDDIIKIVLKDESPIIYGYMNTFGQVIANCIYGIGTFSEENNDNTDLGTDYISFESAFGEIFYNSSVSDGLAVLQLGDRYGFIDKFGKIKVPLIYTAVLPFKNGKTYVRDHNGKWKKLYRNEL